MFLGPRLANRWQEKQRERKNVLRNHFDALAVGAFMPLINKMGRLMNTGDRLSVRAPPMMTYEGDFSLEEVDFEHDKLHASLKLHFPSEVAAIESFRDNLVSHHKNLDRFSEELEKLVAEKTGLPVRGGGQPPFIYEGTPKRLRLTLNQLGINEPLSDDFRRAEIKHEGGSWTVGIGPTGYAVTATEEEAQNCRSRLIELMECAELKERQSQIRESTLRLENDSRQLAEHLDFICQKYIKYGSVLKKIRECSICQVI
ncbi:MAG: hypothetical protein E3J65_04980 [Dehalococcoidia bacterium]|nr:MAG: hypothetical protein E3J65_04980 [Dehalococcoidia bacterium]